VSKHDFPDEGPGQALLENIRAYWKQC